ncbi:MAG: hypothetical protein ACW963_10745, partial [Candidatus Sifarchaeia archaeon]
ALAMAGWSIGVMEYWKIDLTESCLLTTTPRKSYMFHHSILSEYSDCPIALQIFSAVSVS